MATICSTANLFFFMAKPSLSRSRFCRKLTLILDQKIEVPSVTASIGVIATDRLSDSRAEDFLQAADQAMYRSKKQGRNRVASGPAAS
jgi:diguanylate cyclase (GGDEF)-like protein